MFSPTPDVLADAARAALTELGPKPGAPALCAAMDGIFAMADGAWTARRSSVAFLMSAPPIACAAGCGWCCHQQVGVSPVEAIRVAEHVRALPPDEQAPLRRRIEELDARTRGLDTDARARLRLACAFLGADGRCGIYSVRPLRCRGVHSTDLRFCISCYEDLDAMREKLARGELKPVFLDTPERIFDTALTGVLQGMAKLRMAVVSLELTAAIRALLDDPALAGRWLKGAKPARELHLVPPPGAKGTNRR